VNSLPIVERPGVELAAVDGQSCIFLLLLLLLIVIIIIIIEFLMRLLAYTKNIGALQCHRSLRAKNQQVENAVLKVRFEYSFLNMAGLAAARM